MPRSKPGREDLLFGDSVRFLMREYDHWKNLERRCVVVLGARHRNDIFLFHVLTSLSFFH